MATKKQAPDKVHVAEVKHDLRKIHKRVYVEAKKVQAHRTIITSERTWHQVFSGFKPSGIATGYVIYGEAAYDSNEVRVWVIVADGSTPSGSSTVTVTNLATSESATGNLGVLMAGVYRGRVDISIDLSEGDLFEVEFTSDSTYDYNINVWLKRDSTSVSAIVSEAEV